MWAEALERAHRKTSIDNLSALGGLRALGRCLQEERIPFILLKGASYLTDLYDDPGERVITDIDLLLRKEDVDRAASRLARDGFRREIPDDFPYYRRFEISPPWDNACRFEIHWRLGLPVLVRLDPASLWESSLDCSLEGVACRRLAPVALVSGAAPGRPRA